MSSERKVRSSKTVNGNHTPSNKFDQDGHSRFTNKSCGFLLSNLWFKLTNIETHSKNRASTDEISLFACMMLVIMVLTTNQLIPKHEISYFSMIYNIKALDIKLAIFRIQRKYVCIRLF